MNAGPHRRADVAPAFFSVSQACYADILMHRAALLLSCLGFWACQLSETPPQNPPPPSPRPEPAELAPLPPQETPPAELPPLDPPNAKPVEAGISVTGAPTRGKLPQAVIDEKLKAAQPSIAACYAGGLKLKPDLRGGMDINFVIAPDGKVAHADVAQTDDTLPDATTVDCILSELQKLEFPPPTGGRVFVNYPLKLEPPRAAP